MSTHGFFSPPAGFDWLGAFLRPSVLVPAWAIGGVLFLLLGLLTIPTQIDEGKRRDKVFLLLLISAAGLFLLEVTRAGAISLLAWPLAWFPLSLASVSERRSHDPVANVLVLDFISYLLLSLGTALVFSTSELYLYAGSALIWSSIFSRIAVFPFHLGSRNRLECGPLGLAIYSTTSLLFATAACGWAILGDVLRPTLPHSGENFLS